ncbi:hypothetical protein ACM9HB_35025, partial [Streptomyces sp. JAC128]|uniref:hypothetical protein n=1 Tax=Streptomyces sp. JAC128 TaxID=3418412 RepID=UPI003D81688A
MSAPLRGEFDPISLLLPGLITGPNTTETLRGGRRLRPRHRGAEVTQQPDTARSYTLTIICPRPQSTARDDWHIQPERIATTVGHFFADAELTLTPKTVRLRARWTGHLGNLDLRQRSMAAAMSCLALDVPRDREGPYLPLPEVQVSEVACPSGSQPDRLRR